MHYSFDIVITQIWVELNFLVSTLQACKTKKKELAWHHDSLKLQVILILLRDYI